MGKRVGYIGHSLIMYNKIILKLEKSIENEIENGADFFTMGTHGDFDKLALSTCKILRKKYQNIQIEVAITSLHVFDRPWFNAKSYNPYSDVKTIMYDIEDLYYKKRITESNKQMIDNCDTLICYVDERRKKSGAKIILRYAQKKGVKIVNLFDPNDIF